MRTSERASDALLTQAGLNVADETSTVSLQALEYFTSTRTRFYLRSTLPITSGLPAARSKPTGALRAGILDPFGGLLNATLGTVRHRCEPALPKPRQRTNTGQSPPCNPPKGAHLTLDARAGIKLLEVPGPVSDSSEELEYRPKPFFSGVAMVKALLPLRAAPNAADTVGHLTLGVGLNVTAAGAKDYLASLAGVDRTTVNAAAYAAIDLPGVFYINIEGTPWSSNDVIGGRFVVSVNAMKK